jgi:hypothetical protein
VTSAQSFSPAHTFGCTSLRIRGMKDTDRFSAS